VVTLVSSQPTCPRITEAILRQPATERRIP